MIWGLAGLETQEESVYQSQGRIPFSLGNLGLWS